MINFILNRTGVYEKSSSAVSVIGGADGPTSIFKKNAKLTLKQKIQRAKIKLSGSMWIKPFHVKVIVWMK